MPQTPKLVRELIRSANRVDLLSQQEIRTAIGWALDIITTLPESRLPEARVQISEASEYLLSVAASRYEIHHEDAKMAFLKVATAMRTSRVSSRTMP